MSELSTFNKLTEKDLNDKLLELLNLQIKNKKKVYVAGPWFDKSAEIFYSAVENICNEYKNKYEFYFPRNYQLSTPMDTYLANCAHIDLADIILVLIPRKDVGTAYEIGYAVAKNKQIALVGYDETDFNYGTNIMLACCTPRCISINQLRNYLDGKLKTSDFINVHVDSWEGKE